MKKLNLTRPEITQVLFKHNNKDLTEKDLERKIYESRRKIEKKAIKDAIEQFLYLLTKLQVNYL